MGDHKKKSKKKKGVMEVDDGEAKSKKKTKIEILGKQTEKPKADDK